MKKFIALILVLCICCLIVSCSGTGNTDSSDPASSETSSADTNSGTSSDSAPKDSGIIALGSADLQVGMTITGGIIDLVGEPDDIMSAPSCFFDGEDTIYVYEDFSLYTYRDGDKDVLYIIELSTDKNATELGGKVGMAISDIEELYGYDSTGTATSKVYKLGQNSKLRFSFDESETVTLIEYELIG